MRLVKISVGAAVLLLVVHAHGAAQFTCFVSWSKKEGDPATTVKVFEAKLSDRDTTQAAEVRVIERYSSNGNAFVDASCRE